MIDPLDPGVFLHTFILKNVSTNFFLVRLKLCGLDRTILLCIKDRFVQELVQTSQKKFSVINPNGPCRLEKNISLVLKNVMYYLGT